MAGMSVEAPWVVIVDRPLGMHCGRCGTGLLFSPLPIAIADFLEIGKEFTAAHRECPEDGAEVAPAHQEGLL